MQLFAAPRTCPYTACCAVLSATAVMWLQAEERAEKEAHRQMEKDAKNREREEAKKMARYPIEDTEVCLSILHMLALALAQSL